MKREDLVPGKTYKYGEHNPDDYTYIGVDENEQLIFKNQSTEYYFPYKWTDGFDEQRWHEKLEPVEGWINLYVRDGELKSGTLHKSKENAIKYGLNDDPVATVHLRYTDGKVEIVND